MPLIERITSVDFARINQSAGQKLPDAMDRLVFTAAIDGPGLMRHLQSGYLRCVVDGKEQALYDRLLDEFPSWLKEAKHRRIIN